MSRLRGQTIALTTAATPALAPASLSQEFPRSRENVEAAFSGKNYSSYAGRLPDTGLLGRHPPAHGLIG